MRTLLSTALVLICSTIVANAEPPPQATTAAAPAITVSDAQANALPAVVVSRADSIKATAGTTQVRVDTPGAGVQADRKDGHGLGFWAVIVALVLIAAFLTYRYFTRDLESSSVPTSRTESDEPNRTRGPSKSGRPSDRDL